MRKEEICAESLSLNFNIFKLNKLSYHSQCLDILNVQDMAMDTSDGSVSYRTPKWWDRRQQLCQPTEQGCPTSSYLPLSLFRLLSQEWCWWFPRMRAPASVYFVYFVKSISPECLVDLLNSNVVCWSKRRKIIARTKDWRSRRRGKDNSRNSKIYPMCSDDDGVALKLANPRILYI